MTSIDGFSFTGRPRSERARRRSKSAAAGILALWVLAPVAAANAEDRASRVFREDWREIPAATPVTQEHVAHSDLRLDLHGPGRESIRKSHHENIPGDPFYIWSGQCEGNWAVSLSHGGALVDLTAPESRFRWRAKQSGFRRLRPIIRLEGGDWLVADQSDDASAGWRECEFIIADLNWRRLDIETVVEGRPVEEPDLTRVEAIGFTDLKRGGGTPASSRLDWIEVWGMPVDRD